MNCSRNVCDWTVHIELKALELSEPNDANSRTLMSVNSLKSQVETLRWVTRPDLNLLQGLKSEEGCPSTHSAGT